jgi:mannose-1-phosphate guanylyltransferase/phosphomannomutase
VNDSLNERCALRPVGVEIQPQVWLGKDAEVDSSAVISAPAFIGAGSRISWNCAISGASAIERNCEIDCASTVNRSHILQDTYVGVGLDVRHSIVGSKKLFHLDRNVEIDFVDDCLIGATSTMAPLLATRGVMSSPG